MRAVRPWHFGKPKTPGFGLTGGFYLSVLSSKAAMPTMLDIVEPSGANHSVVGFGAPLASDASKESLSRPLERGAYVLATKDRKTVVRMLVLSKEEAGFDPETFARSALALQVPEEALIRIRATWTIAQLTFESHEPMVYAALDFLLEIAQRISFLSDGVVSDPISRRYLLPEQVLQPIRLDPRMDAREHVSINLRERADGLHMYTLGLQKFGLPELEVTGLKEDDATLASRFLIAMSQNCLLGDLIRSGDRFGSSAMPFEAREGGFERELWEGVEVLELLPPTASTPSDALVAWDAANPRPSEAV